jgi:hypothetical protein
MNENYLWNKEGEPDPEVKELEEILGVLRYQPRKLVIPGGLVVQRRRNYVPLLAIAATIVFALLAAGLWFGLKSVNKPANETANKTEAAPKTEPSITPNKVDEQQVVNNSDEPKQAPRKKQRRHLAASPALIAKRQREREEALAAKEQLLIALRLASEKLNQAQRKTQHPATPNQIRNQHKVS